jgi:EAL domain-containing protein (putative c-di-GMP-specific phosphodiesterase class I)
MGCSGCLLGDLYPGGPTRGLHVHPLISQSPKVDVRTRGILGAESLARLTDTEGNLVFPDRFIALAEQHGLITDITWHMLAAAMKQAKCWHLAGHAINIAVNISMDDLSALDFPDNAASLAGSVGVDPGAITLEVTETKVMSDSAPCSMYLRGCG